MYIASLYIYTNPTYITCMYIYIWLHLYTGPMGIARQQSNTATWNILPLKQHLERMFDCHVSLLKGMMRVFPGHCDIWGCFADERFSPIHMGVEVPRKPTSNRDIIQVCFKSGCVPWKGILHTKSAKINTGWWFEPL